VSDPSFEAILDANRERLAWLSRKLEESKARGERAASIQASLDATSASVWSKGRLVRATVASSGLLTNLEYAENAASMPPTQLATLTVETIRRAMAAVQERIDEITLGGDEADVGNAVASEYHRAFASSLSNLKDDTIGYAD
jgi:hypothetical protein